MSTIRSCPTRSLLRTRCLALLGVAVFASAAFAQPPSQDVLLVSSADLAARANDADLVVLHVADRLSAFEDEHIPGARFVRYGDIAVDGDGLGSELPSVDALHRALEAVGVSDTSRIIVYSTSTVMAARLFFTLDVFGHQRVALLDGGLRAWKAEGRPTARGAETSAAASPANKVARAGFSARLNANRIADAEWIQSRAGTAQIGLVDVRPDPEFTGADGGMGGAHVAGHIASARQLPWNSLVDESGRFLPATELRAKLEAIGIVRDKPVVSYCMVGMRASVVYFVARYLGYDARLYDGSIVDWGRRGLPTVKGR